MLVAGIDPGLKGAVAFLNAGGVVAVYPMPIQKTPHGDIADSRELLQLFKCHAGTGLVVVERQQAYPKDRKKSIFTLGRGYGQIEAAINISLLPAIYPLPAEWKKAILKGTKMDKAASIGYCQTKYPSANIKVNGKPHDGLAEAILIAEYGLYHHAK